MNNKALKTITINLKAVYAGGGALEVLAGAELSEDDVSLLVQTVIAADPFYPVLLITPGRYKQVLPFSELEIILAEPLAARRAQIAAEQAEVAAKQEKARQEAETLRIRQEREQAEQLAAQEPTLETAIG